MVCSTAARCQECLPVLVPAPITDRVLFSLDSARDFGEPSIIQEPDRTALLRRFGYIDSVGVVPSAVIIDTLAYCGDSAMLFVVYGIEHTTDVTVWLVTTSDTTITSCTIVAALQVLCDQTYVRACTVLPTGELLMQQVQHAFDCDTQEHISTTPLPSCTLTITNSLAVVLFDDMPSKASVDDGIEQENE
jgi:hypothetical protein